MNKVMTQALRLLTRREYSQAELSERLLKDFSAEDVEETLQWCTEKKLLSDERFLESRVRHRIYQGYGPRWIEQDLRTHGLLSELIQEHLAQDAEFWIEQAFKLLLKKYKKLTSPSQKIKLQGYLYQRGFLSEHIRSALMKFEHL